MPYDPNNDDQKKLIQLIEYRADEVTKRDQAGDNVQKPAINYELVYTEMENALAWVLMKAPRDIGFYASQDGSAGAVVAQVNGIWTITPPASYIRFLSLKMNIWSIPVTDLLDQRRDLYRMQTNWAAAAQKHAPVGVLVAKHDSPCKVAIEVFPGEAGMTIDAFQMVATEPPEDVSHPMIKDAMLWEATSRTLNNLRYFEGGAIARERSIGSFAQLQHGKKEDG